MQSRIRPLHLLVPLGLLAVPARAQSPPPTPSPSFPRWHVEAENDYFNFWQRDTARPDAEYTAGTRISHTSHHVPGALHRLFPARAPCPGNAESSPSGAPCLTTTLALVQRIYTPPGDPPHWQAGQRPHAGWLALAATVQAASFRRYDALGIEFGVTGPASLAQAAQTGVHRLLGHGKPAGWRDQLRTEPGIVLAYAGGRAPLLLHAASVPIATAGASWRFRAGNVVTDASAGLRALLGWNVPSPWAAALHASRGFGAYLIAGVRADAVVRNLVLDGNTFIEGPRVAKRAFVGERELGLGLRWRRFVLEWRAVRRAREYVTQAHSHTYSSIGISF